MINSQMYSFNSSARISSSFLSSFLVPKKVCKSFTSRCVFCNVALFSCSAIKLSTEPTSTNLSDILKIKRRLASFRAICLLCSDWLGGSILDAGWLYFYTVKKAVRDADWTYCIFHRWNIEHIYFYNRYLLHRILVIYVINIDYFIESAAYGDIFTSCLCKNTNERVSVLHKQRVNIPRTKHFLRCFLFITCITRIHIQRNYTDQL